MEWSVKFNYEMPRVVTIYADKGGDGKTTTAVELACCLGSAGYRVLAVDLDTNNGTSYFFVKNMEGSIVSERNTARAFIDEENDLKEFTIRSIRENVDVIPCSRGMASLRSMYEKRVKRMLPTLNGAYDFVIFDCKPNYDNFALNAFHCADIILTPVQKSLDSYNAAVFLKKQLSAETDKSGCWYLTINGFDWRHKDSRGGEQKEYLDLFRKEFRLTPSECWFPWTKAVRKIKDLRGYLSRREGAGGICAPALYEAVVNLASSLVLEDDFTAGEVF